MKTKKKGFTLVELLVVIAILAILATVSVVGYLAFINKAKESNDVSLTTQMNTALQANEAVEGKAETMTDALDVLSSMGLDVTKLTPTSEGYNYVYDSASGRMLLLGEDKKIIAPADATDINTVDTFAIVKNEKDLSNWLEAGYGVYLAEGYNGPTDLKTLTSVDVADSSIKSLTIEDSSSNQNAIIKGTLDSLTLTVPKGSVDLYGDATIVNASTADHSLHVYGHIQQLNLTTGKVVVKANGEVNTIDATKATDSSIDVETNGIVGAVISNSQDIVTSGNVTVTKPDSIVSGFAGGVGTEDSPYLISSVDQWMQISQSGISNNGLYFIVISNLNFNDYSGTNSYKLDEFTGHIDFTNHDVYVDEISQHALFDVVFSGSSIKNVNYHFSNMASNNSSNDSYVIYAVELKTPEDVILESINMYGNLQASTNNLGLVSFAVGHGYENASLKFINCNNYANITSSAKISAGIFLGKVYEGTGYGSMKVFFESCSNYGTLIHSNGYASMLISNGCSFAHNTLEDFTVINCKNYGTILGNSDNTNLLCGGGWSATNVTIEDIKAWVTENSDNLKNVENGTCSAAKFTKLSVNSTNKTFDFSIITDNSDYTYNLSFNYWVTVYQDETQNNELTHGSFGLNIDLKNQLEDVNSYNWISESLVPNDSTLSTISVGDKSIKVYNDNGTDYFVFEKNWLTNYADKNPYVTISNVNVSLFVYDSNQKIVEVYTYEYPEVSLN